jgi:tyrosine-protein kinase Etk/Wzc
MENSVAYKKRQADETISFLDKKLDEAAEKVNVAAAETAKFRTTSNIADSKMELNMAFNERMQYNVHDVNYDLQRVEIKRIYDYLKSGKGLQDFAPNFEAFNDPVFRDAFLKMQAFELQKQDLLVQYTPKSKEVISVQDKINQLSSFLNESISNALGSLKDKQDQLKKTISQTNSKISALPDKQYHEAYHARNLQLNEEVYSQLVAKKASLSLAASSIACYHHVIEAPDLPRTPFAPNKTLLLGLGVLFALGFGILLAYLCEKIFAKVRNEADLEALQLFPVLGRVNRLSPKLGFSPAIMNNVLSELTFLLKKNEEKQAFQIVTFCSAEANTGKSFLCEHIARVFAQAGKRVLLVDTHIQKNDVAKRFEVHTNHGITEMIFHGIDPTRIVQGSGVANLDLITAGLYYEAYTAPAISNALDKIILEMGPRYDILLVDTSPMLLKNDAFPILLGSHINLFIARYKRSRLRWIKKISNALIDRNISSVYYVLNDAPTK